MRQVMWWVLGLVLLVPGTVNAQDGAGILFIWDNTLTMQPLDGGEPIALGTPSLAQRASLPTNGYDVYRLADSPLAAPPADGFHHGVWSPDRTQFAYLTIAPDASGYRVRVWRDGTSTDLITGTVSPERGYLDPLAWAADGTLLLAERTALYYTPTVRVWRFDVATGVGQPVLDRAVSPLTGNSLVLPGATEVFLGFDVQYQSAYKLDLQTLDLVWFSTGFALPYPPKSAFERYALEVVGIYEPGVSDEWLSATLPAGTTIPETALSPWLHWPLPDTARSITCYPDSAWTRTQFEFTCPGLSSPRPYDGHQGTDVGGQVAGLRVGTPVYATAPGVVIERFTACQPNDVPCNGAYGNTITVEHVRVRDGDTQIWHTGYAHLSRVLAEPGTAVSDIAVAIALSGDTGIGGPHLHFEVRYPFGTRFTRWIDPWEVVNGGNLWLGDGDAPPSAAGDVEVLLMCRTENGNNVRSGPGTAFEIAAETRADTPYAVVDSEIVTDGGAQGEWYQIREGDGAPLGWVWSGLMTDCLPPGVTGE